jgi:hypothetical protein
VIYRQTQRFLRIEAVGSISESSLDLADPSWLMVRVTPSDDLYTTIESAVSKGGGWRDNPVGSRTKHPYRLSTGIWAYDLDEKLYQPGKSYTIFWRAETSPDTLNVFRRTFIWGEAGEDMPREIDGCVLYGTLAGINGAPIPEVNVIIEQFENARTLSKSQGSVTVKTNSFGMWQFELKQASIARVIAGDAVKVCRVPAVRRASLRECPEFTALDVIKDRYGYPLPGEMQLSEQLASLVQPVIAPTVPPVLPAPVDLSAPIIQAFPVPALSWVVHHNRSTYPAVTVVDDARHVLTADIVYVDANVVQINFNVPTSGTAILRF